MNYYNIKYFLCPYYRVYYYLKKVALVEKKTNYLKKIIQSLLF